MSFLYRKTDFYRTLTEESKVGFPPGVPENMLRWVSEMRSLNQAELTEMFPAGFPDGGIMKNQGHYRGNSNISFGRPVGNVPADLYFGQVTQKWSQQFSGQIYTDLSEEIIEPTDNRDSRLKPKGNFFKILRSIWFVPPHTGQKNLIRY